MTLPDDQLKANSAEKDTHGRVYPVPTAGSQIDWQDRAKSLEKDLAKELENRANLEKDLAKERRHGQMFYLGTDCRSELNVLVL